MNGKTVLVELNRCTGCHACEIACKMENDGNQYINVAKWGPEVLGGEMKTFYIPFMSGPSDDCRERLSSGLEIPCVSACPTIALRVAKFSNDAASDKAVLYKGGM